MQFQILKGNKLIEHVNIDTNDQLYRSCDKQLLKTYNLGKKSSVYKLTGKLPEYNVNKVAECYASNYIINHYANPEEYTYKLLQRLNCKFCGAGVTKHYYTYCSPECKKANYKKHGWS